MRLPNTKILIIIAGIILVILVTLSLLISSLNSKKSVSQPQTTLIPTGIFESGGSSQNNKNSANSQSGTSNYEADENDSPISDEEITKLEELKNKIPVETADFILDYSSDLGEFFVQTKNSQGEAKLKQYLSDNGLLDIYKNFPELFHIGSQSVTQLIDQRKLQAQNIQAAAEKQIEENTAQQQDQSIKNNQASKETQIVKRQQALFFDFIGALTDFELGASSGGGDKTIGGGENGNLPATQPYSGPGTPQLKKIMSAIKAIPGLSWSGICANPANGGHIPNSEHYHCNAVDVFGAETTLDNAFATLLAAAKNDALPIHCLIYKRHIYSRESNWAQDDYHGASTHDYHIHISGWPSVGGAC